MWEWCLEFSEGQRTREAFGKIENGISTTSKQDGSRHFWRSLGGIQLVLYHRSSLVVSLSSNSKELLYFKTLRINVVTYGNRLQGKKRPPRMAKV